MTRAPQAHEILAADPAERSHFGQLARLLIDADAEDSILLVHGEDRLALPRVAAVALRAIVERLADGTAIALVPLHRQVRTQEAADLLDVSRPHLVELQQQGEIPFSWTGKQRRIRLEDVLAYKARRDRERRQHLDEVVQLTEELGLYDE